METPEAPDTKPKSLKDDANAIRGKTETYNVPGRLPLYLSATSEEFGTITWVCGVNEDGVIRGITRCNGSNEAQYVEYANEQEAFEVRDALLAGSLEGDPDGPPPLKWFEVAQVQLVFNQKDGDGNSKPPNRKQARKVARKLRQGKIKK